MNFKYLYKNIHYINKVKKEVLVFIFLILLSINYVLVIIFPNIKKYDEGLLPNSKVFAADNEKYSPLMGGKIIVYYTDIDNNKVRIKDEEIYKKRFNHVYNKMISNLTFSYFEIKKKSNSKRYTPQYLAAIDLLCRDNYKSITIKRVLVKNSKEKTRKEFTNEVKCNINYEK